jgi:hypothetical protein
LQREGIINDKSDLDRAVALPKMPRKPKEVTKRIKITYLGTDQARRNILKTYKRLSDMEDE